MTATQPVFAYPHLDQRHSAAKLNNQQLEDIDRLMTAQGLFTLLETWEAEDLELEAQRRAALGKAPAHGGRPRMMTYREMLVVALALLLEGKDAMLKTIAHAIEHRLDFFGRRLLGLSSEEPGWRTGRYMQVQRTMARLDRLINAHAGIAGRKHVPQAYYNFIDGLELDDKQRRHERAITFSNLILEGSIQHMPREWYDEWDGSVVIDATAVRVWGKGGNPAGMHARKLKNDRRTSAEPDAGTYRRGGDHNGDSMKGKDEYKFAWDLAVAVSSAPRRKGGKDTIKNFPFIATAIALNAPGVVPTEMATSMLTSLHDRGHPAGEVATDMLYFPMGKPEKLQRPARSLGYEPVFDLPEKTLGQQLAVHGALLVDSNLYSPALPNHLVEASEDYRDGKISEETYDTFIAARTSYLLGIKEWIDNEGRLSGTCPALGRYPTLNCERREIPRRALNIGKRYQLTRAQPNADATGKICETGSVTFDLSDDTMAKYLQKYQYQTDEWARHYHGPRSIVESYNADLKNDAFGRLDQPGLRRSRGYGKQLVIISLMVAAVNIHRIGEFLKRQQDPDDTSPPSPHPQTRAPRRRHSLMDSKPSNSPPAWLPGHPKKDEKAA